MSRFLNWCSNRTHHLRFRLRYISHKHSTAQSLCHPEQILSVRRCRIHCRHPIRLRMHRPLCRIGCVQIEIHTVRNALGSCQVRRSYTAVVNIVLDQVTNHIFRGQSLSVYCFINGYFYDLRAIRRGLCDFARVYTGNTVNIHFTRGHLGSKRNSFPMKRFSCRLHR